MSNLHKKNFRKMLIGVVALAAVSAMAGGSALASNLEYRPVSPAFGGNPSSAMWSKFNAHVQKRDSGTGAGFGTTIPDFSGLFDSLDALEGDLSDTTIIIPVF